RRFSSLFASQPTGRVLSGISEEASPRECDVDDLRSSAVAQTDLRKSLKVFVP
ncbi:hypothetical protein pipiens_020181, partial [Culex pipiens pipiens]